MFKFFCVLLLFFCKSWICNKNTCPILVLAADLSKVMYCFEATLASYFQAAYKTLLQPTYWSWNKHFHLSCLYFIPSKLMDHQLLKIGIKFFCIACKQHRTVDVIEYFHGRTVWLGYKTFYVVYVIWPFKYAETISPLYKYTWTYNVV